MKEKKIVESLLNFFEKELLSTHSILVKEVPNEKRKKIANFLFKFLKKKLGSTNNILVTEGPNDSTEITIDKKLFITVTEGKVNMEGQIAPDYLTPKEIEKIEYLITTLLLLYYNARTLKEVFLRIKLRLLFIFAPIAVTLIELFWDIGEFFFYCFIDPIATGAKTLWKYLQQGEK